jgi:cytosine deaminase
MKNHIEFMRLAFEEALNSYNEGGIPVGAVIVENDKVIAWGHNRRVQNGDPVSHGEIDCIRSAGRRSRYDDVTLYTTLSPCMMCSGAIVQFGIKKVVVGENKNFSGNIEFLEKNGVEVLLLNDSECERLMKRFIMDNPELWDEDVAGNT